MRKIWLTLIIMTFLVISSSATPKPSFACSCATTDIETALDQSSEVFVGSVISIEETRDPSEPPGTIGRRNAVLFEVERSYKQPTSSQIIIYVALHEASCGYDFEVGQPYLVYGNAMHEDELHTSLCSRTQPIELADEDLAKLGEGFLPTDQVDLRDELDQTWVDTVLFHIQRIFKLWLVPEARILTLIAASLLIISLVVGYLLRATQTLAQMTRWAGTLAAIAAIFITIWIVFFNPFSNRVNLTEIVLTLTLMFLPACLALFAVWGKSAIWMFVSFLWALPLGLLLVAATSVFSVAAISVFLYFICAVWLMMAKRAEL